jgi:hypothetical protein
MSQTFKVLNVDDAIKKLTEIKMKGNKEDFVVLMVDFDNDKSEKMITSFDESCNLIRNAATITHNEDELLPHMELFSNLYKDKYNIKPNGVMHDILLCGVIQKE